MVVATGNKEAIYTPAGSTGVCGRNPRHRRSSTPHRNAGTAPNLQMASSTSGAIVCYTSGITCKPCATPAEPGDCATVYFSTRLRLSSGAATQGHCLQRWKLRLVRNRRTLYHRHDRTHGSILPARRIMLTTGTTISVTFSEAMNPSTVKALTGTTTCTVGSPLSGSQLAFSVPVSR